MAFLELTFSVPDDDDLIEIFTANLVELGFDSFLTEENFFKAYVESSVFNATALEEMMQDNEFEKFKLISSEPLPDKNWNALWESAYEPVIINSQCRVRAPFHAPDPAFAFDLLIEPRMSFGTAHHETTSQMLAMMLRMDFKGKSVLDMGSGTAVLAILARKMGATNVVAIDNDSWAYSNALDNIRLNEVPDIEALLGDAATIGNRRFNVVIANINRNILLADMHHYVHALLPAGTLMMSGFYIEDLPAITEKAVSLGLNQLNHSTANRWVAVAFQKK